MSTSRSPARGLRLAPFRGLRYVPERVGSLAAVTSPPYDVVIRPDGQLHLAAADPHNVVRLILPQATSQAAWTLCQWQQEGVLAPDPEPALYVYEQRDGDLLQRGLIGALRLTPPAERVVLPHEDVMPGPVADRAALMRATAANLEPLLLVYQDGTTAAEVVESTAGREPLLTTTTEDGVRHRLWHVTDPDEIAAVNADLSTRQALIADGHHRWATYLQLQGEQAAPSAWDYGLVLLVDTTRYPLRVRAIHRVLPNLPVAEAVAAVRGVFRVRELPGRHLQDALAVLDAATVEGNAFLLGGDGGFRLLDLPDPHRVDQSVPHDRPEAWRRLDAAVLHSLLLEDVWQVPDAPEHIAYIHDPEAAVEQAERHGGTAVLLHPVRETVVRELARQGITMPRKSTSFGPKPASGLVMRSLGLG
ncbi:DUF1015 domain-containing protein [Actinacidiphila oryziradicis]|jgi:uncharacterized protein (DUF1015 family)|uniref:DUF1015 domain-containing protein n=1 Tax=Actinacidiphila oryziradicis TaxID=2571141 RepID=A0A4U0SIQ6_9ACTN|nr:DUF1015 domain-containing protein [Actinacidiphila oryziradicis]MCW2873114.1 SpoOJ or ParA or ParB or repB family protein [Actinacidiphila oryziradicis]MCW2873115.1 SpoOJ or ParA or ParB or repB family protein [Actinacidiphila oryziradicis]TKA08983.1 DUF1015 domain-containing protein [Actinacidiphila oryziradicis]